MNAATSFINKILRRRHAYRSTFQNDSGKAVLADLKRFCRGMEPPLVISNGTVDTVATGVAIGRQEVWFRIINHLNLDDSDLLKLKEQADE